jgi:hypothetical protein
MKTYRTMYRSTARVLLATALLLSIPLAAKLFSDEMAWSAFDFVLMGVLIAGVGLVYELAVRMSSSVAYRAGVGVALLGGFLLLWVNLAVGIIGSEDNPANLMYLGVLAVAFVGAASSRLQPRGMQRTMFAAAFVQALIAVIAMVFRMGAPASGPAELLAVNGMFVALFVGSAALFREAARGDRWRGKVRPQA